MRSSKILLSSIALAAARADQRPGRAGVACAMTADSDTTEVHVPI